VNLWRLNQEISGDLIWTKTLSRGGDQTAGGAAVSIPGTTYVSFHDNVSGDVQVVRYDSAGVESALTTVATGVTATVGSHSIALDEVDVNPVNHLVYVAATVADGNIAVEQYTTGMVDTS